MAMTIEPKPKESPFTLAENERIVAAWAEECNGPGWANWPIIVLIAGCSGSNLRTVYIQPGEQGPVLPSLHKASAAMTETLVREVRHLLAERRRT